MNIEDSMSVEDLRRDEDMDEAARQSDERSRNEAGRSVYFIGSASGAIKIGVAVKPPSRLKELQTGHPERLTILATTNGGLQAERAYHVQFAAHRLHGEWFYRHPDILAEIARLSPQAAQ